MNAVRHGTLLEHYQLALDLFRARDENGPLILIGLDMEWIWISTTYVYSNIQQQQLLYATTSSGSTLSLHTPQLPRTLQRQQIHT